MLIFKEKIYWSCFFPLEQGLIIASHTEEIILHCSSAKFDPYDMFRMTSVTSWNVSSSARISKKIDQTIIISCSPGLLCPLKKILSFESIQTKEFLILLKKRKSWIRLTTKRELKKAFVEELGSCRFVEQQTSPLSP